ncbi:MAG: DNA primase, partial [Pyrinomonadaceae bacterium]|nr:DNA primase [Pyrinomonadaceae bacterium]
VFNFVMEIANAPFGEAVKIVADKSGVSLPEPKLLTKADEEKYQAQQKAREIKKKDSEIVVQLNIYALDFWENFLNEPQAKTAREYLEKRELSLETIKTFRIGYAPDSWDAMLNHLKSKGASEKEIEMSGLVTKNDEKNRVYDRFRGRIIFPVLDEKGKPVAFGGRIMDAGEPKYLNSPETAAYTKGDNLYGLFQNAQEIRRRKFAILVEGYLDLLTPYQNGVKTCVASLGTSLTQHQARLLNRFTKRIVINYDGDKAGIKAAKRAIEILLAEEFEIKTLVLPDGADPDDFIRKNGVDSYNEQRGKKAISFAPFVLEQISVEKDFRNSAHKSAAIEEFLPFVRTVKSSIQKRDFFDAAMNRFQIADEMRRDLWRTIKNEKAASNFQTPGFQEAELERQIVRAVTVKPTIAEQNLLEMIIHDVDIRAAILPTLEVTDYETLASSDIFRALVELSANNAEINAETLQNKVGDSDMLSILLLSEPPREIDEPIDEYLERAERCVITLRFMAIENRILVLKNELATAEQNGENERFNSLMNEQLQLSRLRNELNAFGI